MTGKIKFQNCDREFNMPRVHHSPEGLKSHILMEGSTVTGCGRTLRRTVG